MKLIISDSYRIHTSYIVLTNFISSMWSTGDEINQRTSCLCSVPLVRPKHKGVKCLGLFRGGGQIPVLVGNNKNSNAVSMELRHKQIPGYCPGAGNHTPGLANVWAGLTVILLVLLLASLGYQPTHTVSSVFSSPLLRNPWRWDNNYLYCAIPFKWRNDCCIFVEIWEKNRKSVLPSIHVSS